MIEIGSLVDGKYKVLNEIGHGGMSVVYLALNERANKTWAIKEVRKTGASNYEVVKQGLIAETNILKKLSHPNLPSIVDVIDYDDSFLIVMDYIEGTDLSKRLENGPQNEEDVVRWSKELCDVLAYLHARRPAPIIYRDMKPANVMLKPDGHVMLMDFGTAREYKSQRAGDDTTCLGTKGYAAPEQYGGMGQSDARTDIYCLGATMYHLVTGHNPSMPPYEIRPIRQINPRLSAGLEEIILKCTRADPNERYQNCAELMYDLEHYKQKGEQYVRKQKGKVARCAVCAGLALVMGIAGIALSVAASRSSSAAYNDAIKSAARYYTSHMTAASPDYGKVREGLERAVQIDPSSEDAWIYLTRLFRADYVISSDEIYAMDTLLNSCGAQLEKNKSGYAQFCMEWGQDIFCFYGSEEDAADGSVGDGNPAQARPFLGGVTDANLLETDGSDRIDVDDMTIQRVSANEAAAKYELAQKMYTIANSYEKLNKDSILDDSYSYGKYWDDLEALMTSAQSQSNALNNPYVESSLYASILSSISLHAADLKNNGIAPAQISDMVSSIEEQVGKISRRGSSSRAQQTLLDNITEMISGIRTNMRTIM